MVIKVRLILSLYWQNFLLPKENKLFGFKYTRTEYKVMRLFKKKMASAPIILFIEYIPSI